MSTLHIRLLLILEEVKAWIEDAVRAMASRLAVIMIIICCIDCMPTPSAPLVLAHLIGIDCMVMELWLGLGSFQAKVLDTKNFIKIFHRLLFAIPSSRESLYSYQLQYRIWI